MAPHRPQAMVPETTPMLDFRAHTQLVDATAQMMRSYALAATQTFTASACQGLSLWSELLRASGPGRMPSRGFGVAASPLEMFLRLSPAGWMWPAQARSWSPWPWMPGAAAGVSWTPFARTWAGPSFTVWAPLTQWTAWSRAPWPAWNGQLWYTPFTSPGAASPSAASAAFSSYRSAGGHAVAPIAPPIAEDMLAQMQSMLGAWRMPFNP
jgi:hypothetical protein